MLADMTGDLKLLIKSRHPIIAIETPDEARAVELIHRVTGDLQMTLFEWSITTGLRSTLPTAGSTITKSESPKQALAFVKDASTSAVYVFKDLAAHLDNAHTLRHLREIQDRFSRCAASLILVDSARSLPDAARRLAVPFEIEWPDAGELAQVVRQTCRTASLCHRIGLDLTLRQLDKLAESLRGLTTAEAGRIVAAAIFDDMVLNGDDLPRVLEAKRDLLASKGILRPVTVDVSPDELGGLERLKQWLARRRDGFSDRAAKFGLTPPRGMLLIGVQGCGKSLSAKLVAADWGLPLVHLDPGVLYQKFVGETESRLRKALAQTESMAPVVLWIDEIEKAFASAESAAADGGLSRRIFGTLLTWLQDHPHPIFVVATANDISSLPPELVRKGRFDEIFFVDLPGAAAREQILAIHLRKRRRDPGRFGLRALAEATDGFSGAEIEQLVISALYAAFADRADLSDQHLVAEVRATNPLSVVMAERIERLRTWARGRCVPAD